MDIHGITMRMVLPCNLSLQVSMAQEKARNHLIWAVLRFTAAALKLHLSNLWVRELKEIHFQDNGDNIMPATAIEQWQMEGGVSLPADYRNYVERYGANYIYPNAFVQKIPQEIYGESDGYSILEKVYGWDYVVKNWRKEIYGEGTPDGCLVIGDAQGFQVLLSLRREDFGVVYCWMPTTHTWGGPGNNADFLYLQANSFSEFLASLFDTEIGFAFFDGEKELAKARSFIVESLAR